MTENQKDPLLISHRARGFDKREATRIGVLHALKKGLKHLEVDTRRTKDGNIIIHHDAKLNFGGKPVSFISEMSLGEIRDIFAGNKLEPPITLDELLNFLEEFYACTLYLDIKEHGNEKEIVENIVSRKLLKRVVFVSWLPEVLKTIHQLQPKVALCVSFYPQNCTFYSWLVRVSSLLKKNFNSNAKERITYFSDAYNKFTFQSTETFGYDSEHFIKIPFYGELLDILKSTDGIICMHYTLPSVKFVNSMKKAGLKICLYGVNEKNEIEKSINKFHPDMIMTDNPELLSFNESRL